MYKTENLDIYLCQGDIILKFSLDLLQTFEPIEYYKGILILSFTCDLKNDKLQFINYCPIYSLNHRIIEFYEDLKNDKKVKKEIRKKENEGQNPHDFISGKVKGLLSSICNYKKRNIFFLKKDSIFKEECYANLEQIYSIPIKYEKEIKKCRVASLINPWIEKLGYMLGFCFNRVAIEEIEKSERDSLFQDKYQSTFNEFVDSVLRGDF